MAEKPTNKVLRFAVIQGGKVIEDRTLDKQASVTIGNDTKNTIVVPMGNLPKTHTVFELRGQQYNLCFTEQMDGKLSVAQGNDKVSFAALKSQGVAKKKGDHYEVALADNSKGSVQLGEVTLLFQFVNPPKAAPKMELPAAAKGNFFNTIDRTFTAILMGFLIVEFTGAYVIAQRQVSEEEITLDELPDRFVKLVVPDKPKEPPKPKEEPKQEAKAEEKPAEKKGDDKPKEEKKPVASAAEHKEAVKKAVESKGLLKLLGTAGASNSALGAVNDVLGAGSAATNVADALAGATGVATATGDDPSSKGPKGGAAGTAAGIGDLGTGPAQGGVATEKKEVRVSGRVMDSTPDVESSDIDREGLARFVKTRLKSIQTCYERELKRNPGLKGKIVVRFTIGTNGRVTEVEIDENTLGSDEVANCIRTSIKVWTTPFKPESEVPVSYPFVFQPSS